jgi:hypothetical protein
MGGSDGFGDPDDGGRDERSVLVGWQERHGEGHKVVKRWKK